MEQPSSCRRLKGREAEWILKFQICVNRERLLLLPRRRHRRPSLPRPPPTSPSPYSGRKKERGRASREKATAASGLQWSGAWVARILWQREKVEKWKKTHVQITSGVIGMAACLTATFVLAGSLDWLDRSSLRDLLFTATHTQIESVGFMRRRTRDVDSG